ncbi:hypothetical protein BJY01DRAFT_253039 [Aspergillus pseudoustus]|uniref:Uncharacterized protein n=1 Tax=Aspergillus pseudoustus TaxID=1810923 RepID=A0ABR4J3G9_9EURO
MGGQAYKEGHGPLARGFYTHPSQLFYHTPFSPNVPTLVPSIYLLAHDTWDQHLNQLAFFGGHLTVHVVRFIDNRDTGVKMRRRAKVLLVYVEGVENTVASEISQDARKFSTLIADLLLTKIPRAYEMPIGPIEDPKENGDSIQDTDIEFIISDAEMQKAIKALKADGIRPCDNPKCPELSTNRHDAYASDDDDCNDPIFTADNRYHPVGAAHFHFKTRVQCFDETCYYSRHPRDDNGWYYHAQFLVMHLFHESDILFGMGPQLQPGPPAPNDPHLILSNDCCLPPESIPEPSAVPYSDLRVFGPSGPWEALYPVKILNLGSYIESIIWLLCRDMNPDEKGEVPDLMWRWWNVSRNLRPMRSGSLGDRFRPAWEEMIRDHGKVHGPVVLALRDDLIRSGKLPIPAKGQ